MSAQEAYHHGMVNAVVPKDGGQVPLPGDYLSGSPALRSPP